MDINLKRGTIHNIPNEIKEILLQNHLLIKKWNSLTDLARNEWICWVISVKKSATRQKHIRRFIEEITEGKKRPCCWAGCPHR